MFTRTSTRDDPVGSIDERGRQREFVSSSFRGPQWEHEHRVGCGPSSSVSGPSPRSQYRLRRRKPLLDAWVGRSLYVRES
jgi:hypothetical protein